MQDSELAIFLPERKRTKRNPFFHGPRPTSTNERLQKHGGTVATLSIRPASFNPSSSRWITDNRIASAMSNNWPWTMRVFLVAAEHGLLRLYNYRGYDQPTCSRCWFSGNVLYNARYNSYTGDNGGLRWQHAENLLHRIGKNRGGRSRSNSPRVERIARPWRTHWWFVHSTWD